MFDIIKTMNEMFKSEPQFYKEILFKFCAEYQVYVDELPNTDTLRSFVESIPKSDQVQIEFEETPIRDYMKSIITIFNSMKRIKECIEKMMNYFLKM